jgi:S1-C subfamily serine protease
VTVEAVVSKVFPGGQAVRVGVRVGDILVRYDGAPVKNTTSFQHASTTGFKDSPLRELIVLRDGSSLTFSVAPGPIGVETLDRVPARVGQR